MQTHVNSNCMSHSNKQLSDSNTQLLKQFNGNVGFDAVNEETFANNNNNNNNSDLEMEGEAIDNLVMGPNDSDYASQISSSTLFDFAKSKDHCSKPSNTLLTVPTKAATKPKTQQPSAMILCPHCPDDVFCDSLENFQLHLIRFHPDKLDDLLTHGALMASYAQEDDPSSLPQSTSLQSRYSDSTPSSSSSKPVPTRSKSKPQSKSKRYKDSTINQLSSSLPSHVALQSTTAKNNRFSKKQKFADHQVSFLFFTLFFLFLLALFCC
ncbi:phospholipase D1 [Reticulomyxa filosa]|uniref:Phospholipase D1 n=1 Tax=Reticulomyxa filosa TaxID=46433 RepID=X6NRI3_RETFI|nr:phospholipase D1 [Reticulomyxa filosa]|eukprot:ETO28548.1 phospholipase D1 [Reticulomyxa filosa]